VFGRLFYIIMFYSGYEKIIKPIKANNKVYLDGGDGKIRVRIIKKKKYRLRKPKDMKASLVGDIVQLDAITYHIGGVKRYLINCIDLYSRVAFSYPCTSLNSTNTRKTIQEFQSLLNVPIVHVQTDNGLENHKHFDEYLSKSSILHFWNNPRSPKQNAYIERFNRTIEEEFADWNLLSFKSSILDDFKSKLTSYLNYYNYKRPHYSLQYKTPMSILHQLDDQKSQMY
jgi:transposase InsO family protein